MSLIHTNGLEREYFNGENSFLALKDITLSIEAGEIVSILGPSGCGKSTLLNCLSGIDTPTSGDVFINEKHLNRMKDMEKTEFRAGNMGFVFQFFNLIPVLNASENVELALLAQREKIPDTKNRSDRMRELVGEGNRKRPSPAQLSGGERQRVSIARALIHNPKIVWADEPTGALDTETGARIMDLILKLNREKGQTFVIVTHDERIARFSNRIMRMDSGRLI